jgi:isocitrate/isopropylmalate dehydrogenase
MVACCGTLLREYFLGDGIGAEVTDAVKTIFKHENVPVEWDQVDVTGVVTGNMHSEHLYRQSVASLKRNKVGLKGTELISLDSSYRDLFPRAFL